MIDAHRIRRMRWRVLAGSQEQAFSVRMHLRRSIDTGILGRLEQAFDLAAPPGEVIHIPRLELTLRVADPDALDGVLFDGITRELASHLPHGARPAAGGGKADRRLPVERTIELDALIEYLETGLLPWFAAGANPEALTAALAELATGRMAAVVERAPAIRPGGPAAVRYFFRLLSLLPRSAWPAAVRTAAGVERAELIADIIRAVENLAAADRATLRPYTQLRVAAVLIAAARARSSDSATRDVLRSELSGLGPEPLAECAAAVPLPPAVARILRPDLTAQAPAMPHRGAQGSAGPVEGRIAGQPGPAGARSGTESPSTRSLLPERSHAAGDVRGDDAFALPVEHAGLVIVAPYLPRLFEALKLADGPQADLPEEARSRAAAALLYVATGRDEGQEFELAFIKILIGLGPDAGLPFAGGLLTTVDREEIDHMLEAVIAHWPILKGTSRDGLRTAFLQRRGLISEDADAWRLSVESSGIDALLDYLPWAISTVKLPWVTKPIFTQWTAR